MYSLFFKYISKEIEQKETMIAFTDKFWRENKKKVSGILCTPNASFGAKWPRGDSILEVMLSCRVSNGRNSLVRTLFQSANANQDSTLSIVLNWRVIYPWFTMQQINENVWLYLVKIFFVGFSHSILVSYEPV